MVDRISNLPYNDFVIKLHLCVYFSLQTDNFIWYAFEG